MSRAAAKINLLWVYFWLSVAADPLWVFPSFAYHAWVSSFIAQVQSDVIMAVTSPDPGHWMVPPHLPFGNEGSFFPSCVIFLGDTHQGVASFDIWFRRVGTVCPPSQVQDPLLFLSPLVIFLLDFGSYLLSSKKGRSLDLEVSVLMDKSTLERVPLTPGFYSHLFVVPKVS